MGDLPTQRTQISAKEFFFLIPTAGTAVALSYDVGFFVGFDISFFTVFSITEHIVFALQALPLVMAITVGLAIGHLLATLAILPTLDKKIDIGIRTEGAK